MGRAIVRRPEVFLFDEPLSNLDPALRNHMRVELKRLHRQLDTTIVHVTHDQVEALTLADRIVVLEAGVVQQIGTPRELFAAPANTFVAQFIGAPPMNLLRVVHDRGQAVLADIGTPVPWDGPASFTLGIRPSDLRIGDGPLSGTVDVIESLGHEALLHVDLGGHSIVVTVPEPVSVAPGDTVSLDTDHVHRFDVDTGLRLP
jgi:ABC-type sugar transport system ATPase subunit